MKYQDLGESYQEDIDETLGMIEGDLDALRKGRITLEQLRDALGDYTVSVTKTLQSVTTLEDNRRRYKYIVAWGERLGSMRYYVDDQVCRAASEDAPETAYARGDKGWLMVDDLPAEIRAELEEGK